MYSSFAGIETQNKQTKKERKKNAHSFSVFNHKPPEEIYLICIHMQMYILKKKEQTWWERRVQLIITQQMLGLNVLVRHSMEKHWVRGNQLLLRQRKVQNISAGAETFCIAMCQKRCERTLSCRTALGHNRKYNFLGGYRTGSGGKESQRYKELNRREKIMNTF